MFFIDELKDLKLYKKKFLLPMDEKNKRKGGVSILMGTDAKSSIRLMQNPLMIPKYYQSYYMEQSVMYYINQESREYELIDTNIITETVDDIIPDKGIIIKGYSSDVRDMSKILNKSVIKQMSKDYNIKLDYPITIIMSNKSKDPDIANNTIYICPRSSYNNKVKDYNRYVRFCLMSYILSNVNPNLDKGLHHALCLYESGLYTLHKGKWIFDTKLLTICKGIEIYEVQKGHKALARAVKNDPISIYKDTTTTYLAMALVNKFNKVFKNTNESFTSRNDEFIETDNGYMILAPITEDKSFNAYIKRDLYAERFKNIGEMKEYYSYIKQSVPDITKTFMSLDRYQSLNLFLDTSHYNMSFIKNNNAAYKRGYGIYNELMRRLINDDRLTKNGYTKKSVLIPISDWDFDKDTKMWLINQSINPISCIYFNIVNNPAKLKEVYKDTTFVFIGENGYFKLNFDTVDINTLNSMFVRCIKRLRDKDPIVDDDNKESSTKAITMDIVDKVEKSQGVKIDNISTDTDKDDDKSKLVKTVAKAAEKDTSVDDTLDSLDQDDELKQILADLSANADQKANISDARSSRMIKLQDDLMDKQFKDKSVKDLLDTSYDNTELRSKELNLDTVNDEWKELSFATQEEVYDMDADIVGIFNSFTDKRDYPLVIRDIKVQDNSTSEDSVVLYTVSYESDAGKRFTIKLDIPIWIDNKYLKLRGNKKDIPNQLFLMPIIKTATDTVQFVSNYKKIFIRRFGESAGKSFPICDKLIKTITKNEFKSLKVQAGDNKKVCNRYELPIDYIDMASNFNKLITPNMTIYFNQLELREKYGDKIDEKAGIPIGVQGNSILYYNSTIDTGKKEKEFISFSEYLYLLLSTDSKLSKEGFMEAFNNTSRSVRYTYSRASILNSKIPLILVCAYSEGLSKVLKKGNIKYRIEKNKRDMDIFKEDFIKFKDAVLIYKMDYASSLLLNGLKACNTDDYSIAEMDDRLMYLDFLDNFGGRVKADGLDNFYNLFVDKPITYNSLQYYNFPTDYIEILLYGNRLLADNKFAKHTYLADNRRIRRHEQIPAMLYTVLSRAYEQYCNSLRHGRYAPLSIKQSALIDEILVNSTTSDKSVINALSEYEAYAAVTPKGPSGMNSDRSYTLDKRGYDKSMLNIMGMSTGFAGNVGINRQMTIDATVSSARGYIKSNKEDNIEELSPTKSFCMTEALTPFGSTRDDPMRTAMTFVQTSKHGMRCKRSNPALITSGADEALPYLISNIFAHKAKEDGVVKEVTEDKMIIEYKDGSYDYIDLSEKVEKNSSSGFYVTLKLDTNLKEGKKVKKGDIVAYDKSSFSDDIGCTDNVAYNIGTLAKFALLNTDENYEDSAIISKDLSDAMTSDVILQKDINLTKDTDVYNLVKKGDKIEEGDTLLITQSSYDDEDVQILMRNLSGDDEEITDLGRVPIKSKVTGWVQDIKIYRTAELDDLSPTLKKIVSKYEKNIEARKKEMKSYGVEGDLGPTGKLPQTGKLKNLEDGVRIEIYVGYEDRMSVGDKLIYYSANKGVVKDIFPEGKEPRSSYRPNEKIHSLAGSTSVNKRMVGSIITNGAIYKGLIELSRQCKDILGIKYKDNLFE